ncbi:hypothetical protein Salat_1116100 [Sesamum alatum]|uniref:Uncharacterized protein n=1 Tax=Sesamum alatum TaxID=300844 RepID=A0AAE1YPI5_9LAMI|nr:hypothetical protein Salat_1116100 [Sesamum alatum]
MVVVPFLFKNTYGSNGVCILIFKIALACLPLMRRWAYYPSPYVVLLTVPRGVALRLTYHLKTWHAVSAGGTLYCPCARPPQLGRKGTFRILIDAIVRARIHCILLRQTFQPCSPLITFCHSPQAPKLPGGYSFSY